MKLAALGSEARPHAIEPEMDRPYGDWCACSVCGLVAEETEARAFCADKIGNPLECSTCTFRRVMAKKGVKTG